MNTRKKQSILPITYGSCSCRPLIVSVVLILAGGGLARAQATGSDAVERSMTFVDKTTRATELFNENKLEEAVAIFGDLAANYADLDEDGYVSMALGDCLAGLGQQDEARVTYELAAALHPELRAQVAQRIMNLKLAGEVTADLIEELRSAAQADDESRVGANWRLAHALVKRAGSLLNEAAGAFRLVGAEGEPAIPSPSTLLGFADTIEEAVEDLANIVERDGRWVSFRFMAEATSGDWRASKGLDITVEKHQAEQVLRLPDGRRMVFHVAADKQDCELRIKADGKPVSLTKTQRIAVHRYWKRINAILVEACGETKQSGRGR